MRMTAMMAVCLLGASGCQEQRDDAQKAVEAAKVVMDLAKEGQRAQEASAAAEKAAREQIAPGTNPADADKQVQLAKSIAAMNALGKGGPAVNWRQLVPFAPDALGEWKAKGELDGSTNKTGGFEFSTVSRSYESGARRLRLKITDATSTPFLRAPFAMVAMVSEDSSKGYKKGKTIEGSTAIVEWKERSKESSVVMLVAERYVVDLRISDAVKPDEAETMVATLKLADLAKLTAEAAPAADAPKK